MIRALLASVAATCCSLLGCNEDSSYLDKPVPVLCEEDEVLYFEDYKGPGQNTIGELICVHMDEFATP